jgi:hypothetical protein
VEGGVLIEDHFQRLYRGSSAVGKTICNAFNLLVALTIVCSCFACVCCSF